ncbi:hypothetical protein CRENBAI_016809 [Crenichthys baileyi]|uniref:Uncharacterized protein n=1 Tax=Crenichthys baileyi TaxID=28760 RepID=A0AAV9REX8_9TELE
MLHSTTSSFSVFFWYLHNNEEALVVPVYAYRRGQGCSLACLAVKHCLKHGQQRGSIYGFTAKFKESPAASPCGHDSNEGKSTVESISAMVLILGPAKTGLQDRV